MTENINFILVFLEGILSFLSPCILPLIPIYISYLAGNGKEIDENGQISYKRKTVLINTILFVLGISFAFFLLGMTFSALGSFFQEHKQLFTQISGGLIIVMGIIQLGIIKIKFFEKEHKINTKMNMKKMNPLLAFVMGFTFSFAWTPCVGPALASVLALASSSTNVVTGNLYVLIYTIGFIIPFILLGLFTTKVLNFLKTKPKILQYTIKISAVILIIMGILTVTGATNGLNAFLNRIANQTGTVEEENKTEEREVEKPINATNTNKNNSQENNDKPAAFDFTLHDQYGKQHTLSEYKGKVVFLNFWATWCPPCKQEMPHIESIYKEYGKNEKDVVILGIANPQTKENPYASDVSETEIKDFLTKNKYTFPVVFDKTSEVFTNYYINSFPTTFIINQEGNIEGYAVGAMSKERMKQIIEQTLNK